MSKSIEKLVILLMLSLPAYAIDDNCIHSLHMLIREVNDVFLQIRDTRPMVYEYFDNRTFPRRDFTEALDKQVFEDELLKMDSIELYDLFTVYSDPADIMTKFKGDSIRDALYLMKRIIND